MLMKILQKIPVFDGLELHEAEALIQVSTLRAIKKGDEVYKVGEPSSDMLVLIKGKLIVVSKEGKELAAIPAGTSTGEMGVFTGHRRSATIVAAADSLGLVLSRQGLSQVMSTEKNIKGTILENVVSLLADRLEEANTRYVEASAELEARAEAETSAESEASAEVE